MLLKNADVAYGLGIAAGIMLLAGAGALARSEEIIRQNDFAGFWAGARLLVRGVDLYDAAVFRDEVARLGVQLPDTPVFGYPPWTAIALAPLGALPLEVASALWTVCGVLLAAIALRALLRTYVPRLPIVHALVGLTLFGSRAGEFAFYFGQWSFLLVAALAASVIWLRGAGEISSGFAAVAMMAKPHLFVVTAPALLLHAAASRRWRAVRAAMLAGGTLVVLSVLIMPNGLSVWLATVAPVRAGSTPGVPPATLTAALSLFVGASFARIVAVAFVLVGLILIARFDRRGDAWLAVALSLSSVAAIYTRSYDHLLLLVPMVIAAGVLARRSELHATSFVTAAAGLLIVVSPFLAELTRARIHESLTALVPATLFLMSLAALWPLRRGSSAAGP